MTRRCGVRDGSRRAGAVVAAATLVAVLAAGAPTLALVRPPAEGSAAQAQQPEVAPSVTWFVGPATGGLPTDDAVRAVVDPFDALDRDVELSATLPDPEDGHADLGRALASAAPPGIVGPMGMRSFTGHQDHWLDLGPLAAASGVDLGLYDPGLLGAFTGDGGALLGLPFAVFPSVMYFNRDLFDQAGLAYPPQAPGATYRLPDGTEAPWDWELVREIARRLTLDSKGRDATHRRFDEDDIVQWGFDAHFSSFIEQAATMTGDHWYVGDDGAVSIPDGWRDAAKVLHDARFGKRPWMPTTQAVTGELLDGNPLASDRVAMEVASLSYTPWIVSNESSALGPWSLAMLPRSSTGEIVSPLNAEVIAIPATTDDPAAAFEVLEYLLGSEELHDALGTWPARSDLYGAFPDRDAWTDSPVVGYMSSFPESPSYLKDVPGWQEAHRRIRQFGTLLGADPAFRIDGELETLEKDLQAIVESP